MTIADYGSYISSAGCSIGGFNSGVNNAGSPALTINITLRRTTGISSSYPDNYKLYAGSTLLYNSDWDYTADLVWSNVAVSAASTLTVITTLNIVESNNPYVISLTNNTCGAVINKFLPFGVDELDPFNLTSFTSSGNVQLNFGTNYSP